MRTDAENQQQLDMTVDPPIRYVAIETELSGCGRYAFGSWDILVNRHTSKRIRATVLTRWVYRGTQLQQTDAYNLDAAERLNLGCDFWRPDLEPLQEFDRKITGAIYL